MKVVFGDVWKYSADVVCIPTNGTLRTDHTCVMGKGVALQACVRYPGIDIHIGARIYALGNHVHRLIGLCTFPVKHDWWEEADLELIRRSATELKKLAGESPTKIFVLPRPGCGNGGLTWVEVKPVLEAVELPDNVHIIERNV